MKNDYDYYNLVEKVLLEIKLVHEENIQVLRLEIEDKIMKLLKQLGVEMSRNKPSDWNKFLDVIISS
jgi:hypothetical protein